MASKKTFVKPLIFQKLNRKILTYVLKHLPAEDLSRLSSTCRRLNNLVQYYVNELQVMVDWSEEDEPPIVNVLESFEFNHVILNYCSPADFFYPHPPFRCIKSLYLCYEDKQNEKLNLTKLICLKYLKIRGEHIQLSKNRLPSVTHLDLDDPDSFEKQVFRNMKKYHLEVNIDDYGQLHNMTPSQGIKYVFTKTLDILLDKQDLEHVSFTIILPVMELLLFEQYIDSLTDFLRKFEEEIHLGSVSMLLKHKSDYEIYDKDRRRWDKAWHHLENTLEEELKNFDLRIENYVPE